MQIQKQTLCEINDLPNEILYIILSYVSHSNISRIARVSKLWYYLTICIKQNQFIIFSNSEYNIKRINLNNMCIDTILSVDFNTKITNLLSLGNNRFFINLLKMEYMESRIRFRNITQIVNFNNNQINDVICPSNHIFSEIYISIDRTCFAIVYKHVNNIYCLDKIIIIYDSSSMNIIETINICRLYHVPIYITKYISYVSDMTKTTSYVTDKLIFMDQRQNIMYPFYLLDIKTGRLINIKISIPDDFMVSITYLKLQMLICDFSIDGKRCLLSCDKKYLILDISNLYSITLLNYISTTKFITHFKLSNDGNKLFLFIRNFYQTAHKDNIDNIDIEIWDLYRKTKNTIYNRPIFSIREIILNLEEYINNIINDFYKLKIFEHLRLELSNDQEFETKTCYLIDEHDNWYYFSYYLPNAIYSDPYIITFTKNELCVINKYTKQIIGKFNSNGICNIDCY